MALSKGFHEVIPNSWLEVFDERELELMLCGLGAVDVQDWRKHTDYRNIDETHPLVRHPECGRLLLTCH
jgi:hypothetical protein